ncbi:CyP450 monooxygenase [Trametes elegans]|nr:CyP450 monooxygenase [Trametes elegans]
MDILPPWLSALFVVTTLAVLTYTYSVRSRGRLPPGPKPLPLIGNALDMPTRHLGREFRELSDKYGEIVYLNVFGQPTLVMGSYKAIYDLLESKSAISSDRARSPMAEMTGFMWDFTLEGYTPRWRAERRAFHQAFNQNAIKAYQPTQVHHARRLLHKLLVQPDKFIEHVNHYFGATIMGIVYGLDVADDDDKYLNIARKAMDIFIEFVVPGRYLVESLHFLKHVPSWFPGAGFKRKAKAWRKDVLALRDVPFDAVVENIAKRAAQPCIVTSLLEEQSKLDGSAATEHEELPRNVAALAYITGADTTFSDVVAFFLAMLNFPSVQQRAQAELDAVVGPSRLPDFADRAALPYVNALVKECTRWHVVVPVGIPHRTLADDVYEGYFIPKGTVLVANAWAVSRDPVEYPDPEEFRPERFLGPNPARDPMAYAFGNGRRICPGRYFADSSLFILISSILHTMTIAPPLDESGRPVPVEPKVSTNMLVSYPERFDCCILPRSEQAAGLIGAQVLFAD